MVITQGAREDLAYYRDRDPDAAAWFAAFLRGIAERGECPSWLVDRDYSDDVVYDIVELSSFRRIRVNAYRLRFVEIHYWRMIVAIDHPSQQVAVMAIMHRSEDYEKNTGLWAAIEREYDELGFTRL